VELHRAQQGVYKTFDLAADQIGHGRSSAFVRDYGNRHARGLLQFNRAQMTC